MKADKFQSVGIACGFYVLAMVASPVVADPLQDLEDCRAIKADLERLACLDAAASQLRSAGMAPDSVLKSQSDADRAVGSRQKTRSGGALGAPGSGTSGEETGGTVGAPIDGEYIAHDKKGRLSNVTSTLTDIKAGNLGPTTLSLSNGQIWKITERRVRAARGEKVTIRRGRFGGYFLQVGNDLSYKAIRIDEPAQVHRTGAPQAAAETRSPEGGLILQNEKGHVTEISTTLKEAYRNNLGHSILTLANGQIWRAEGRRIRTTVGETVTIRRGRFGGYFLRVGTGSSVKAKRIDKGKSASPGKKRSSEQSESLFSRLSPSEGKEMVAPVPEADPDFGFIKPVGVTQDTFGKTRHTDAERATMQSTLSQKVSLARVDARNMFIITLENGQVWRQSDGRLKIKQGDVVVIKKGSLGSHFLQLEGRSKSVRVKRVS